MCVNRMSLALLFATAGVFAACWSVDTGAQAKLTFVNESDARLCFNVEQPSPEYCNDVKPHGTSVWRPGCGYGERAEERNATAVLTVAETGREIYKRTATCKEWNESGGRIVIEESGGELIVTDSLPDP